MNGIDMARIRYSPARKRERGVAVVTALLLTTLAITIVASLFWQQQVQVRSIENQRLQLQKQWILRGALDWSRLILREDFRINPNSDNLTEPWAVTLAETRLDQYVENNRVEGDVGDATLSGGIADAQARYNLRNLSNNGAIEPKEVEAFRRLLTNLRLNQSLAQATADAMATAQRASNQPAGGSGPGSTSSQSGVQLIQILNTDDLLAVPGYTPDILDKLRDYIAILPVGTKLNVNTAPAEVLAARIGTLSLAEATNIVNARKNTFYRQLSDFSGPLSKQPDGYDLNQIDVKTKYFFVNGNVRLNRAGMQMQALIERPGLNTRVIWIREN
jgi:general secretion pathway protein K